jgi:hypothetical protein
VADCRVFDASLIAWSPPAQLLATRLRQKLFLARYGRVDPFAWEGRDVNELRHHHDALIEIMQAESAARATAEEQ